MVAEVSDIFTSSLDIEAAFGTDLICICMKLDDDVAMARRVSDEASERDVRLAQQAHFGSLFETTAGTLRAVEAVGQSDFSIIY